MNSVSKMMAGSFVVGMAVLPLFIPIAVTHEAAVDLPLKFNLSQGYAFASYSLMAVAVFICAAYAIKISEPSQSRTRSLLQIGINLVGAGVLGYCGVKIVIASFLVALYSQSNQSFRIISFLLIVATTCLSIFCLFRIVGLFIPSRESNLGADPK